MGSISTSYRRLTYLLVISTFLLILLGGYVKAINAGLACPDWPLCYGKIFPFFKVNINPYTPWQVFTEWFHRLWAASVGILLIGIVYLSQSYRSSFPALANLSIITLILFGAQVLFGALTVWQLLNPIIVVLHLGNAIIIIMIEMTLAFFATIYTTEFAQQIPNKP